MAVVNGCLKCFFIGKNIINIILGFVTFISAIVMQSKGSSVDNGGEYAHGAMANQWIGGIGILVVASLGIYGARKEKKWPLVSYLTASVIGAILMLMGGASFIQMKAIVRQQYSSLYSSVFDAYIATAFGLAVFELFGIILAAVIIRQLVKEQ